MSRKKQIESTDWLTKGIPKEQLEREKQEAIMSADLEECHAEFNNGAKYILTTMQWQKKWLPKAIANRAML